jgi:hypothetical protein
MAEGSPFRGIRHSPSAVEDLSAVVSPPYDINSPLQAARLRWRSLYNAVNLELTHEGPDVEHDPERFARPAGLFRKWLQACVLLKEPSPAMYLFDDEFFLAGRARHRLIKMQTLGHASPELVRGDHPRHLFLSGVGLFQDRLRPGGLRKNSSHPSHPPLFMVEKGIISM